MLTSQWPNTTGAQRNSKVTWFSISPAHAGTSGLSEENRWASKHLAQFGQPKMKADGLTTGGSLHDRNERAPRLKRVSTERDKEQNGRARHFSKEQDEEQDGRARRFSKEQDREQNGFRSALGSKTIGSRPTVVALSKRSQMAPRIRSVTLIDAPGKRTPSAAHQTIENAAESEIGPTALDLWRCRGLGGR